MPPRRTTASGYRTAHSLRKHPTPAETKLWAYLRGRKVLDVSFRRQHAIGPYVTDFCSPARRLVIELDGGGHVEREAYDRERTAFLESQGYRVIRFWNNEIMKDIQGVMKVILAAVETG